MEETGADPGAAVPGPGRLAWEDRDGSGTGEAVLSAIWQEQLPFGDDPELDMVEAELYRMDRTGDQVAAVLRDTLDQLYDGQHSGRWNYDQLRKTEKTHMGTLVEINLHRQFGFDDGDATDYRIAGIEVDCKYSMSYGGWELPPEAIGHLCLVVTASDADSSWMAGLVRVRPDVPAPGLEPGRQTPADRGRPGPYPQAVAGSRAARGEPVPARRPRSPRPHLHRPGQAGHPARPGQDQRAVPAGAAAHHPPGRAGHRGAAG